MFDFTYFNKIDTHAKAYSLGLLYADGNVHKDVLQICLKDNQPIEFLKKQLQSSNKILIDRQYSRISFAKKGFALELAKVGLLPCKSHNLLFPSEDIVPIEFVHSFMLGYFDGDGCIQRYKPAGSKNYKWQFSIISSKEFCESYLDILIKTCNLPMLRLIPTKKSYNIFEIKVCGVFVDRAKDIFKFLYSDAPFHLERKRKIFEEIVCGPISNSKRRYKGVFKVSPSSYCARISWRAKDGKKHQKHLGAFSTEKEAAIAYNTAATEMKGERACLNYV